MGHFTDAKGKYKIVTACKDFTQDGSTLYEMASLANDTIEVDKELGKDIDDLKIVLEHTHLDVDRDAILDAFWDMFVVDALLGNRDRHFGNFGLLERDGVLSFAPIYDCGSSLSALLDDESMQEILQDPVEFKSKAINITSCYSRNGKRVFYHGMMANPTAELREAIQRVVPKIKMDTISEIVMQTPTMSDIRKNYLIKSLYLRYEQMLLPALEAIQASEQTIKKPNRPLPSDKGSGLFHTHNPSNKEDTTMEKENYKLLAHAEDVGGQGHSGEGSYRSRPDGSTYNYGIGIVDRQTEQDRYVIALGLDSQDMSWGSGLVYTDDLALAVQLFNETVESFRPEPLTIVSYDRSLHLAETKQEKANQAKETTMEQTAPAVAEDKKEAYNLSLQLNPLKDQSKPTKAMASVAVDGAFAINNITLVQNKDGKMFASFPKQKQGEEWRDIVQFAQDENGKMTKEAQALKKQINDTLVEMYGNNEKSRTAPEVTPTAYEVSARVNLLRGSESATKALATVRIGDLVEINPVRINENSQSKQAFVAMPSAKDKRSESGYRDIVHPINKAMRETISQVTLGKYADQQQWGKHNDRKAEKAKTQEPQTKDTQAKKKDAHEI